MQRHCDITDIAQGYTLGPLDYGDLMTKEKLTRPMVKTYQHHVGRQLPEAVSLIDVSSHAYRLVIFQCKLASF